MNNILKLLRKEKRITQKELATILNLSPSTIAMYEIEKRKPDSDTLKLLADYFDVSVDYLLGRVDHKNDYICLNFFSKRLKLLRCKYSLTQKDLAKKLAVSPATIGLYEQNRRSPDYDMLLNIAKLFDTTTDYLLGNSNLDSVLAESELRESVSGLPSEALDQIDDYIRLMRLKYNNN